MVTECNSCQARYRMNESMMKGFKGVEVRCGKCGGTFVAVPPGDAGERSQPAKTATPPRATPVEETRSAPPVPDNVYCLTRFREALPKRLPAEGYDISGIIRPEPSYFPAERMPAAPPTLPAHREEKGTPFPPDGYPIVPPRESRIPELSSSDGSQSRAGYSSSVYPRLTDIAFVYLLLLFLGGCGYLLVHFLSRMVNGEIG